MAEPLLAVKNLSIGFGRKDAVIPVTRSVSLELEEGRCLGIVGESGSGKSLTALSVLRLLPEGMRILEGSIRLAGRELTTMSDEEIRHVRGKEIGIVYQEPMTALNPVMTVGAQIEESLVRHLGLRRPAAARRALELLDMVGIPDPASRVRAYPHQLSGGLRQRVMIAIAIACEPKLIIADEPTTALDVTIQAQILDLLKRLRRDLGTSIVLITHDLGVVAELADDLAVLYAGRLIERGGAGAVFAAPAQPYTEGLIAAIPRLDTGRQRLVGIPGSVPRPGQIRQGCPFEPRCGERLARCAELMPPLEAVGKEHLAACWARAHAEPRP